MAKTTRKTATPTAETTPVAMRSPKTPARARRTANRVAVDRAVCIAKRQAVSRSSTQLPSGSSIIEILMPGRISVGGILTV